VHVLGPPGARRRAGGPVPGGAAGQARRLIHTIGHSTRERDELVALLRAHGVDAIADVRRFPGSKRLPHFNAEALRAALGPNYEHFPELGGRRSRVPGSPNGGWEVAAFQGYADHMASEEFARGLARLEAWAREPPLGSKLPGLAPGRSVAVMCAEAPWWRCHRRLLADALLVRGWDVRHILGPERAPAHELTEFAHVEDGRLTYPPAQLTL
jgi:uncharacterized protein (DUF488 family)